jgi:hypothetical protein
MCRQLERTRGVHHGIVWGNGAVDCI